MITLDQKLEKWMALSKLLKATKASEMELRRELVSILVPTGKVGTHTQRIGILDTKAVLSNNHKLDQDAIAANLDSMTQLELNAIKMTATLIMAEYKMIPEDSRELLDKCVEVVPASPVLKVDFIKDSSGDEG